jgi:hypothetical protein
MKKTAILTLIGILTSGVILAETKNIEEGLTKKKELEAEKIISQKDINRKDDAVFACEVEVPEKPEGTIYEQGADTYGTWVGFLKDGSFVAHAGSGETLVNDKSANITIAADKAPKGKGTLVWEISISNKTIRVWWNGELIGTGKAKKKFIWAGGNNGGYGKTSDKTIQGVSKKEFNGKLLSPLRYYSKQSIK